MKKGRYSIMRKAYKKARHKKALDRAARWFYQVCIDGQMMNAPITFSES